MHHGSEHKKGKSLRPTPKFKFRHSHIPMKGPERTKRMRGRRGGLRG